ncbi:hypothetical protein CUZ95_1035 [Enterococcus lactis]|nr:hypothetical protein [Enterococcus lactis]
MNIRYCLLLSTWQKLPKESPRQLLFDYLIVGNSRTSRMD